MAAITVEQLERISYLINANYLFFKNIATAFDDGEALKNKCTFLVALPAGVGNKILACFVNATVNAHAPFQEETSHSSGSLEHTIQQGAFHPRVSINVQQEFAFLSFKEAIDLENFCHNHRATIDAFYARNADLDAINARLENLLRYEEEYRSTLDASSADDSESYFHSFTRSWDLYTQLIENNAKEAQLQSRANTDHEHDSVAPRLVNTYVSARRELLAPAIFPKIIPLQIDVPKNFKVTFPAAVINEPALLQGILKNTHITAENFLNLLTYFKIEQRHDFFMHLCKYPEICSALFQKFRNDFSALIDKYLLPFLENEAFDKAHKKLLADALLRPLLAGESQATVHAMHRKKLTKYYTQIQCDNLPHFAMPVAQLNEVEKKLLIQKGVAVMIQMGKILLMNEANNDNTEITLHHYAALAIKLDQVFSSLQLSELPTAISELDLTAVLDNSAVYAQLKQFTRLLRSSERLLRKSRALPGSDDATVAAFTINKEALFVEKDTPLIQLATDLERFTVNYLLLLLPTAGEQVTEPQLLNRKKSYCQLFSARQIFSKLIDTSAINLQLNNAQKKELKAKLEQFKADSLDLSARDLRSMDRIFFRMLLDCLSDPHVLLDEQVLSSLQHLTIHQIREITEELFKHPFGQGFFKTLLSSTQFKQLIQGILGSQPDRERTAIVEKFVARCLHYYTAQLMQLGELSLSLNNYNLIEWLSVQQKFFDILNALSHSDLSCSKSVMVSKKQQRFMQQLAHIGTKLHQKLCHSEGAIPEAQHSLVRALSQITDKKLKAQMAAAVLATARGTSWWHRFKNFLADRNFLFVHSSTKNLSDTFDPVDLALLTGFLSEKDKKATQASIVFQNQWRKTTITEAVLKAKILASETSVEVLNTLYDSALSEQLIEVINDLLASENVESANSLTLDRKIALLEKIAVSKFKNNEAILNQLIKIISIPEYKPILDFVMSHTSLFIPTENYPMIHLVYELRTAPQDQLRRIVEQQFVQALSSTDPHYELLWIILEKAVAPDRLSSIKNILKQMIQQELTPLFRSVEDLEVQSPLNRNQITAILPKLDPMQLLNLYEFTQALVGKSLTEEKTRLLVHQRSKSSYPRRVEQLEIKLSELQSGQFTQVADPTQKWVLQSIAELFNQKASEFLAALQASPMNTVFPQLKLFLPCLRSQTVIAQKEVIFGIVNSLSSNDAFDMLTSFLSSLKQEVLVACRENILSAIARMDLGLLVKLNQFMTRNVDLPNALFGQFGEHVKKALKDCPLAHFTNYEYATDVFEYLNKKSQHTVLDATELLAFLKSLLPHLTEQTVLNCKKNILDIITGTILNRTDIQPTVWLSDLCTFLTDDTIVFKSNLSALLGEALTILRDQSRETDKELLVAVNQQTQEARIQNRLQAAQHADNATRIEILQDILPQLPLEKFAQYKEIILQVISKLNSEEKIQLNNFIETSLVSEKQDALREEIKLHIALLPKSDMLAVEKDLTTYNKDKGFVQEGESHMGKFQA